MSDPTAEPDAGDVEALAKVLADHADCVMNDSRSREWIDGSGVTGIDVWSCGIQVPYVMDLDEMQRLHLAHALAARDDEVRRKAYLDGYEFALRNLHDEPVQADLHRLTAGVNDGPRVLRDGADDAPDESKGLLPADPAPAVDLAEVRRETAKQVLLDAANNLDVTVARSAVITERAECHKRQCSCGHPSEDRLVALIADRFRVALRELAREEASRG